MNATAPEIVAGYAIAVQPERCAPARKLAAEIHHLP